MCLYAPVVAKQQCRGVRNVHCEFRAAIFRDGGTSALAKVRRRCVVWKTAVLART